MKNISYIVLSPSSLLEKTRIEVKIDLIQEIDIKLHLHEFSLAKQFHNAVLLS